MVKLLASKWGWGKYCRYALGPGLAADAYPVAANRPEHVIVMVPIIAQRSAGLESNGQTHTEEYLE